MRSGWILALVAASVMAGVSGGAVRGQGDPRVDGIIYRPIPEPDRTILQDQSKAGPATGAPAGGAAGPEADAVTYKVQMNRPLAKQTYDVQITGDQTSKMADNTTTVKFDLSGAMEVTALNDQGVAAEFNLTIKKFTVNDREVLAAGKVLNAKYDKKYTFAVTSGEAIDDATKTALEAAFHPIPGDENPFVSEAPHKVNGTWAINSEKAAIMLGDAGIVADPKDVTGTVTLKGVETVAGGKALRVEATVNVANVKPNDPNQTVESSQAQWTLNELLPQDATLPPLEVTLSQSESMKVTAPQVMNMTMSGKIKTIITPAPAKVE